MDNIRASIETLFGQINSATILSNLRDSVNCHETLGVDGDMFCQKFMVENKCYTLDQVSELFRLLQTEWVKWPLQHKRGEHGESNLFYILLHYTRNMLVERDGVPVCRYNQLLRWRSLAYKLGEDLFTTSFLAFDDLQERRERESFYWTPVIGQDNPTINHLLGKGVVDLHFHLRGSSLNYELNWIALMNHIRNRRKAFAQLRKCLSYRTSTLDHEKWDTFYQVTLKACCIRLYLFYLVMGSPDDCDWLKSALIMDDDVLMQSEIQQRINVARCQRYGLLDYATPQPPPQYALSQTDQLLSGERLILYRMFRRIYSGDASYDEQVLFYVYLLQKAHIRKELIQLNEMEGFGNFSDYERRKEVFIMNDRRFQSLVPKLAVDAAFACGNLKYLECRISPKDTCRDLLRTIQLLDRQISLNEAGGVPVNKYYYILHFIKKPDIKEQKSETNLIDDVPYRHFQLRKEIRKQGMAMLEALNNYPKLRNRIIGIDAANSELYCRPEVFGPIYRYIKRYDGKSSPNARSLRYTFHVGEDFWDITDGLRAIDEAILFLNLDANDRLGHALALGTNVKAYYQFRNYRVVMSKQNVMDNAMWLTFKAKELGISLSNDVALELQRTFNMYYDEIYLNLISKEQDQCPTAKEYDRFRDLLMQGRDMYVYYQSWLLRGDDPAYLRSGQHYDTLWSLTEKNLCNEYVIQARRHCAARSLFRCYHYSGQVRRIGNEKCEVKIMPEIITLIEQVQHQMCHQIAKLHLGIEANITSNQFIGSMNRYIQHPIVKLYQLGLYTNGEDADCPYLSVSVNTDDRGIFDTSIEEEYALLALALEKEKDQNCQPRYQPRHVYDWLNHIREMGFEQQFRRDNADEDEWGRYRGDSYQ